MFKSIKNNLTFQLFFDISTSFSENVDNVNVILSRFNNSVKDYRGQQKRL